MTHFSFCSELRGHLWLRCHKTKITACCFVWHLLNLHVQDSLDSSILTVWTDKHLTKELQVCWPLGSWHPEVENSLKNEVGLSSEKEGRHLKTMSVKIERLASNIVIFITFEIMVCEWIQSPIKCRREIRWQLILTIKEKLTSKSNRWNPGG